MRIALALLLALTFPAAAFAADPGYLQALQDQAQARGLAEKPQWRRLLHYLPAGGGFESTIDFPGFFLSDSGRIDPEAELQATLAAFFDERPLFDEPRQCRFKARYEWLKAELGFDPARLPPAPCERFERWYEALNSGGITLVFASNDLNSPSSMFGHTLLRLDAQGEQADERLLGYAINYAAETTREVGVLYALKGLTGFYQGHFSVLPYYEKVREYERFEHRDLWEYPLRLDAAARTRLLWHLWELRGVSSDYYFFSENCSYQLLSLLEAAEPRLNLTAAFRGLAPYAIPIDTVRAARDAGLLEAPVHRPANAHRLQHHFASLPEAQQAWVLAYADGRADLEDVRYQDADPVAQAGMLELAHDALYFQFQERALGREQALPRARPLLVARSRNPFPSPFAPPPAPEVTPDQGHGSGRYSLGLRLSHGEDTQALLGLRPAYHDRLDPPGGYLAGGEIEFLAAELSLRQGNLRLDELRAVQVQAVAPRSALFKPWSWLANAGLDRAQPLSSSASALGAFLEGAGGLAWAPRPRTQLFAFGLALARANEDLAEGHDLGAGLRLGAAFQSTQLSGEGSADWLGGLSGAGTERRRMRAAFQWHLNVHYGLRVTARLDQQDGEDDEALELRGVGYF